MILRTTIARFFSLGVATAIGTTTAVFAQDGTPTPAAASTTSALASTLPVQRTVTDTAGRKIEGTILTKDADSVQFRRTSDGKEFDLLVATLSVEDQAFVASLINRTVKKPTVLLAEDGAWQIGPILESAGFAVTIAPYETVGKKRVPTMDKMTDDEIKKFDILWIHEFRGLPVERLVALIPQLKVVVWKRYWKTSREKFIKENAGSGITEERSIRQLYVQPDQNLILYNDRGSLRKETEIKIWPDIQDKLVHEVKNLVAAPIP